MAEQLWKVSVVASPEAEDAIAELLSENLGAPCSAYHDFEAKQTTISAFLADRAAFDRSKRAILERLDRVYECGLGSIRPKLSCAKVRREDWAESWKRHFKPLEIGRKLLIRASWHRRKARPGQSVIILDPGLSFGTGHHPTTAFCLEELVKFCEKSRKHPKGWTSNGLLDAGTGSGILAIAAAKLGFSPVDAFDFDAEALEVARKNAKRNRMVNKIRFFQQDATRMGSHRTYSVVCANLSTDVLIRAMTRLASSIQSGGVLILAGILKTEFSSVERVARGAGLRVLRRKNEKEWGSGSFVKEL
jgi:ribosomal protein L11 methyltransferase